MGGYVANFTVYTMAMIGLICFAVFVYKKIMDGSIGKKHTRCIEIEDTLNLNPRKTLHVIRAGQEKFLIASDIDRTTLISKLNENHPEFPIYENSQESRQNFRKAMYYAAQQKQAIQENSDTQQPKRVHLEPITKRPQAGIGISNLRHSMDERAGRTVQRPAPQQKIQPVKQQSTQARPVKPGKVAQVQKPIKPVATGSTMKDMAKKINQL